MTVLSLLGRFFLGDGLARTAEAWPGDSRTRALDHYIRGIIADEMGDRYRAVFHYQEALRFDSTAPSIYVALAQDYQLLGNTEAAEDLIEKALRISPTHRSALQLKAVILMGTGRMTAARAVLRKLAQLDPRDVPTMRRLLSIELSQGRFAEAQELYERIVALEGPSPLLGKQVVAVFLNAEQFPRAIALLRKLLATDSSDAQLVFALGMCYVQSGDTAEAARLVERACQLDPTEPRFWAGRATIEVDRRRYEHAVAVVDTALRHVPATPGLLGIKGTSLYRLGRHRAALEALSRAVELDSTFHAACGTMALIYDELDSLSLAVMWYRRAIQFSDSAPLYLNNLAYTYAVRGIELDEAEMLVARALRSEPKNGAYLDTMGWVKFQQGRYREALRWLRRAVGTGMKSADMFEHLGDVHATLGAHRKAAHWYRKALELEPTNENLRRKANR